VSKLSRRLARVEERLSPRREIEPQGWSETHYTNAWPEAREIPGADARQCTEHGPTCAVIVRPVQAPVRRVYILQGATAGPWMVDE